MCICVDPEEHSACYACGKDMYGTSCVGVYIMYFGFLLEEHVHPDCREAGKAKLKERLDFELSNAD